MKGAPPRRALVLPRPGCVIFALGHVKGIVQPGVLLLFEPDEHVVKTWLDSLLLSLKRGGSHRWRTDVEDTVGVPFELAVLEEAIREVCNAYQRRVALYRPMVDVLLEEGTAEYVAIEPGRLQRLRLMKDSLSDFELEVSDLMKVIQGLLNSDEDMLGLLLTEAERATRRGEALDTSLHDEVELLLEAYHRQLSTVTLDIAMMERHIQSKQEFLAISLDVYRNRMSRMNVHLGIGAVSLGICTTVAGFMGMNVDIPGGLAHCPGIFAVLTGGSILVAAGVHGLCATYLAGGAGMQRAAVLQFREISALGSVLRNLNALDVALKSATRGGRDDLTREALKAAFIAATPGRQVSDLEVDLVFRSLDKSDDGILQMSELPLYKSH